ncbi:MAG: aldehyde dehydrogenase family protein, partial [Bacillota bacterium]|nr:aldehyde dehydrogenase family protein [Bacillota bacterium]
MTMNAHDYVAGLVEKGRKAQAIAENFTQEDVDLITAAVTYNLTKPEKAKKFAEMLVEESGMGIPEDKVAKIYGKVWGAYLQMKDEKSVGLLEENKETGMQKWAKPMGVVAGIMPVTNGEATPIVKSNMALKTRNAIILAPHPKCKKLNVVIVDEIRATLKKLGYPEDLVQTCAPEWVKLETSQEMMKQCDFILATGGEALVETAYSSGTPAIGVGVGNCVSIVTGKTPMKDVADMICRSKAFDNATSCSTENNIIVFESCYDEFIKEMEAHGAVLFKDGSEEKAKLQKTMWPNTPNDSVLNRAIVAQNAETIAKLADIDVPAGTRVLMAEENGAGLDHPFAGEKLSPVSGIQKAKDLDEAIEKLMGMLNYQGKGHSCGIHTTDQADVDKLAAAAPVTKVVVNQPQCLTNSGGWDCGFPVSMTLGCGT